MIFKFKFHDGMSGIPGYGDLDVNTKPDYNDCKILYKSRAYTAQCQVGKSSRQKSFYFFITISFRTNCNGSEYSLWKSHR